MEIKQLNEGSRVEMQVRATAQTVGERFEYETPRVVSYTDEEILAQLGPVRTDLSTAEYDTI